MNWKCIYFLECGCPTRGRCEPVVERVRQGGQEDAQLQVQEVDKDEETEKGLKNAAGEFFCRPFCSSHVGLFLKKQ